MGHMLQVKQGPNVFRSLSTSFKAISRALTSELGSHQRDKYYCYYYYCLQTFNELSFDLYHILKDGSREVVH